MAGALDTPELALARIDARRSGENFPVASLLAPADARPHLRAIYGFARLVDNIGDEAEGDRLALLDELERELDGPPRTEIMRRLHASIEARDLPLEPFRRLIEANRIDQRKTRYETWDEVREYCTYSAEPVGRLVLAVYGREDPDLVALSDDVCTGLQLVNFLQDPPRDFALGRVYLPLEDLRGASGSPRRSWRARGQSASRRSAASRPPARGHSSAEASRWPALSEAGSAARWRSSPGAGWPRSTRSRTPAGTSSRSGLRPVGSHSPGSRAGELLRP